MPSRCRPSAARVGDRRRGRSRFPKGRGGANVVERSRVLSFGEQVGCVVERYCITGVEFASAPVFGFPVHVDGGGGQEGTCGPSGRDGSHQLQQLTQTDIFFAQGHEGSVHPFWYTRTYFTYMMAGKWVVSSGMPG